MAHGLPFRPLQAFHSTARRLTGRGNMIALRTLLLIVAVIYATRADPGDEPFGLPTDPRPLVL
jgi:hypothetical protein